MVLVSDIYQSRTDRESAIIMRQDPVVYPGPYTQEEFVLSEHQLRSYRKNGFIQMRGLLPEAEVAELLRQAKSLAVSSGRERRPEAVFEQDGREVRSVFRAHGLNAAFKQLMSDGRLLDVARQILGSDVYIHQSRLNLKPGYAGKAAQEAATGMQSGTSAAYPIQRCAGVIRSSAAASRAAINFGRGRKPCCGDTRRFSTLL